MTVHASFRDYVQQDDTGIRPAVGALLFACDEYPGLDIDLYLGRLDALGRTAARRIADLSDPYRIVRTLNQICFDEEGLAGDTRSYYDPRNHFLNEVLDRRRGIPITLSAIYLEVASRRNLPLHGVAFPGHFIVKYVHPAETIFIDPFNAGRLLTRDDLRDMLSRYEGRETDLREGHLRSAGPRTMLSQMLRNLKRLYSEAGAHAKVFWVTSRLLDLDADSAEDVRDQALAAMRLGRHPAALAGFLRYAALAPRARDLPGILDSIRDLRRLVSLMN